MNPRCTAERRRPARRRAGRSALLRLALPGLLLCLPLGLVSPAGAAAPLSDAPAYQGLQFEPPEPGTYELPALGPAADGFVLDTSGRARRLHDFLGHGKATVLSFIYTTCSDAEGCPLATFVLQQMARRVAKDERLRDRVRFVSLSFDPERDTPEVMRVYSYAYRVPGVEWDFLTTASTDRLEPILDAYGQRIQAEVDETGNPTGGISHLLRVYLVDPDQRIRNIYSVAFLHPDVLINDLLTVLESGADTRPRTIPAALPLGPGDVKAGYESTEYATDSVALTARRGRPADLLAFVRRPPLGLPPVPVPADNPITAEKVALGRKLFYDRRLSLNDTFSCAMCHIPEQGFTNNELATAVGIEGRTVRRNAPTVLNSAYLTRLFHDGREFSLEQQIWAPLLARNEMGNPSVGHVIEKIRALPDYAGLFEAAFGGRGPDMITIGQAIASYERTLNAADSPFDRWRYGGDARALPAAARRGYALFTGKAGCSSCHSVGEHDALFTDGGFHNTGIGYAASMDIPLGSSRVLIAPGVELEVDPSVLEAVSEPKPNDLGRYEITLDPADRWKYKTPSLRNVALTAPYMHDGSLTTLEAVVEYYDRGGVPNEGLDPRIRPLGLTAEEKRALVAFMESLTGSNIETLVLDAFAAPIGDVGSARQPP